MREFVLNREDTSSLLLDIATGAPISDAYGFRSAADIRDLYQHFKYTPPEATPDFWGPEFETPKFSITKKSHHSGYFLLSSGLIGRRS